LETRHIRNIPAISPEEQTMLRDRHVLILGCGGLGGCLAELLTRLGVGEITAADGECFEESNLNRQILCTMQTLGTGKAEAARLRAEAIDPGVRFHSVAEPFTAENAQGLLAGKDLALDALDSVAARLLLEDACARAGIPLVHGAVRGWLCQAAVSMPGSCLLRRIYRESAGPAEKPPVLPFAPFLCASVQAAEAVKLLTRQESPLAGRLLLGDLRTMAFELVDI